MRQKKRFTEATYRRDPAFRALCGALAECKSEEEIADLLRDIGTLGELQDWCERLEVAKQLAHGLSYRKVATNTGASTTTVTRVARFLQDGTGGYARLLLKGREHEKPKEERNAALKEVLERAKRGRGIEN